MDYLNIISQAVTAKHGIKIKNSDNPSALRQKFYAEIRKIPHPRPKLKLIINKDELWILKDGS